jgi:pimeloyl-ACP methyl ester carboxylesterase
VDPFEIDVSEAVGEPASLAGARTIVDGADTLFTCLPGGTYGFGYFDLDLDGYSFARFVADHGVSVAAFDNLGTGRSTHPDRAVGLDLQAAAAASAVRDLRAQLGASRVVAVGHSMGGYVAMRQQATHRSYDAVAILGTTNFAVAPLELPVEMIEIAGRGADARAELVEQFVAQFPEHYLEADRSPMLSWFHLADVPPEVLQADARTLVNVTALAAAESTVPGITRDDAAQIDVPVFLAYGDVDVTADAHAERSAFVSSPDVTLFVMPDTGHCHNTAPARETLWHRLLTWNDAVSRSG